MSYQNDLVRQAKAMFAEKYFDRSPIVEETDSGDMIVSFSKDISLIDEDRIVRRNEGLAVKLILQCKKNGIRICTLLKDHAQPAAYVPVVKLITEINRTQEIGCFEFDHRDGEIAVRTFLRCSETIPTTDTIYTLLSNGNSLIMNNINRLIDALKGYDVIAREEHQRNPITFTDFNQALSTAQEGDPDAQYYVGRCYQSGQAGAPVDRNKATYWLKRAASVEHPEALCFLGLRILAEEAPEGTTQDAIKYLEQAANLGNILAAFHLGEMYYTGDYVKQNLMHASIWYNIAAKQGDAESQLKLGLIYMNEDFAFSDQAEGAKLIESAAEQGLMLAQRQTAVNYLMGTGVPEDNKKFVYWLEKAALQGDEKSIDTLREYYPNSPVLAQVGSRSPASPQPKATPSSSTGSGKKSGGCYIATCVYGSYDCPQVWTLRRYRDCRLQKSIPGRLFVRCYYAVSPTLVRIFGNSRSFRRIWKLLLDPIVGSLKEQGYTDLPYDDR